MPVKNENRKNFHIHSLSSITYDWIFDVTTVSNSADFTASHISLPIIRTVPTALFFIKITLVLPTSALPYHDSAVLWWLWWPTMQPSVISEASRVSEHVWTGKRLLLSPIPPQTNWFWSANELPFHPDDTNRLIKCREWWRPNSPTVLFNLNWVIRHTTSKIPAGPRPSWLRR